MKDQLLHLSLFKYTKCSRKKLHQVFGFYQKLKNSCLKLIEFSSTNRIFNHILTFVTLYGAALQSPIS